MIAKIVAKIRYGLGIVVLLLAIGVITSVGWFQEKWHAFTWPVWVFFKQRKALKNLAQEKCALLKQLWQKEMQRVYWVERARKYRSNPIRMLCKQVKGEASAAQQVCIQAGIPNERISAFLAQTYKFEC